MLRIVITRSNFGKRRRESEEIERVKMIWDELDLIVSRQYIFLVQLSILFVSKYAVKILKIA